MSSQIQQAGTLSGRSMTMMVVIGLHALAITALVTWRMAPDWIDPGPGTMAWSIIKDPVPPPPPCPGVPDVPSVPSVPFQPDPTMLPGLLAPGEAACESASAPLPPPPPALHALP